MEERGAMNATASLVVGSGLTEVFWISEMAANGKQRMGFILGHGYATKMARILFDQMWVDGETGLP
jgi:hypothetical protein